MASTTIRIDDELKAAVAAAAELSGQTAQAFIVDAITQTVEHAEQEGELHRLAAERWARVLATGKTVSWDQAKAYLAARARGKRPARPTARMLTR